MEMWRGIPGFEGYYNVSNTGRVATVAHNVVRSNGRIHFVKSRILRFRLRGNNHVKYRCVRLYSGLAGKSYSVHRLVAMAFIPNSKNLKVVNHIDGNTFNNNVENLEWCTVQDNVRHADQQLKSYDKYKNPVDIYTSWGCLVCEAKSIKEAASLINGHRISIRHVIDGKMPLHKGYFFKLKAA